MKQIYSTSQMHRSNNFDKIKKHFDLRQANKTQNIYKSPMPRPRMHNFHQFSDEKLEGASNFETSTFDA